MKITAMKAPTGYTLTITGLSHSEAETLVLRLLAMAEKSEAQP